MTKPSRLLALPLGLTLLSANPAFAADPAPAETRALQARADVWWDDISVMASDKMEGRLTGSAGYNRAADFVISRFHAEGLLPGGDAGSYKQNVAFDTQVINELASTAALTGADGRAHPVAVGPAMLISSYGAPRPASVDAPLVFIGYGLHLPARGHDDFAGLDLKGKIAVVISGGPADLPGPMKAAARSARASALAKAGAVGLISLTTPKQVEIPWARQQLLATQTGMFLADPALRELPDGFFVASYDPEKSLELFAGSGHTYGDLVALADASKPMPTFDLPLHLKATVAATHGHVTSPNLIARLPGSDPALRQQYVLLSAHLDHLGIGEPIAGDRIYNGAMDDASGVASVLDIAHHLHRGPRPKRSILFVIVAGEEKGLLGSSYFARRPTVAKSAIVADLNFDMPLPLWPLKTVIAGGEAESTLGAVARQAAADQGLALTPDPLPNRNSFTRTDQFSFVRAGIPALAFKFGFTLNSPQFQIEHDWRANRYHAPSDDINQPGVLKVEAIKLDNFVAKIATLVANEPVAPTWLATSVFKPAS